MRKPMKIACLILTVILFAGFSFAQDKNYYKPTTNFWGKPDTILTMDFSRIHIPASPESFQQVFHFSPIRQDTTGTCWCFSGTSFLESEIYRIHKKKIKLSEMFTVYYEYVEKARRFVKEKGNSVFGEGSEEDGVINRIKQYGIVRETDYKGLLPGETKYNHSKMVKELSDYLAFIKKNGYWDEKITLTNIKLILNKYMGKPPEIIDYNGRKMTPKQFAEKIVNLPIDDYVSLMSFKYLPFYTKGEYKVPDNWWHSKEYYNVPLNIWYNAIKSAIKNGYSIAIGGDVSEPGHNGEADACIIPSFDIPTKYINQDSREFRWYNHTSQDDHGIHLVGYTHYKGHDWFLIKDSSSSANKGKFKGYFFFRDDYVKLKMLTFMVHKDAVKNIMAKFNK
ncbi:peptidase C1 [bacterium]|nr:peptidase C1 [bacterium]